MQQGCAAGQQMQQGCAAGQEEMLQRGGSWTTGNAAG
jgi:hypothetical protein